MVRGLGTAAAALLIVSFSSLPASADIIIPPCLPFPACLGGGGGGGGGAAASSHAASSSGAWAVGVVGVSVLSVMGRAACVAQAQHRELTSREAWSALSLPFFWVFTEHCQEAGP